MKDRPTLKDVARMAGVHPATASRALSGARSVSPEHVRAVRDAARRLDYQVNPIGRALKQRTTATVGMVVPDIENPFFPALIRGVERALAREGLGLLLCDAANSAEVEARRLETLLLRQVDSLIISSVHLEHSRPAIENAARQVPVVQVDRVVDVATDTVEVDQRQAMAALVSHLHDTGRRRFVFVTPDEPISPVRDRLAAYRDLSASDLDVLEPILVPDLSLASGVEAARRLLAGGSLPEAIICVNDLTAIGAMQTLRQAGINVPGTVAVTGIDDTPFAAMAEPSLTTVRQPMEQIGDEVVRAILARGREPGPAPRRLVLAAELVVRQSTATST